MTKSRLFTVFKYTLVAVIVVESVLTVIHALRSDTISHLNTVLPWFAGLEAVMAALLLVPKLAKIAAIALCVMFAVAIIVHGPSGHLALFVYGAGAVLIAFGAEPKSR